LNGSKTEKERGEGGERREFWAGKSKLPDREVKQSDREGGE